MSRRNDDNSEEVEEWSSEEEEKEWSSASYKDAPRKGNHNQSDNDNDNDNDSDGDSDDRGDDSSIEDDSICESSSSSDDHEEEEEEEHAPGFTSTFLRRRRPQEVKGSQIGVTTTPTTTIPLREGPNSPFPTNSRFLPENPRKPWNRQRRRRRTHCCALYQERRPRLFCNAGRCSSCFLMVALLVWIHVQAFYYYYHHYYYYYHTNVWQISPDQGGYAQSVQERIAKARNPSSSSSSFWGSAVSNKRLFHHGKKRGTSVEDIPSDCVLQDWQRQTFPNCNVLHEIDLAKHLQVPSRYRRDRDRNYTATTTNGRYISSGLWRDVWSLAPNIDTYPHELVVLKMMKPGTYCTVAYCTVLYCTVFYNESVVYYYQSPHAFGCCGGYCDGCKQNTRSMHEI
jgi:hypothetical protein